MVWGCARAEKATMAENDTNDVLELAGERAEDGGPIAGMLSDGLEQSKAAGDGFLWNCAEGLRADLSVEETYAAMWLAVATDVYAEMGGDGTLTVGQSTALAFSVAKAAEDGLLSAGGDE